MTDPEFDADIRTRVQVTNEMMKMCSCRGWCIHRKMAFEWLDESVRPATGGEG